MRAYIVRENSSDKLFWVVTDLHGDDAPYRQFALDILNRKDALDPDFPHGDVVDIDVYEPPTVANTVEVKFGGDNL